MVLSKNNKMVVLLGFCSVTALVREVVEVPTIPTLCTVKLLSKRCFEVSFKIEIGSYSFQEIFSGMHVLSL